MQKFKKNCPRVAAILLSLMMMVVFVPTFAFAADSGSISVYLTVSDKGELAKANDGSPMAWKEVSVTDLDSSGDLTVHDALLAAHEAYNSSDGYHCGGSMVDKLWGVPTKNTLFAINNKGLDTGVTGAAISNGDYLSAAVMVDETTWTDWYTFFNAEKQDVTVNTKFTLTVKGHLGMAYTEDAKKDIPLKDMVVKTADGDVLGTTDKSGQVNVTFSKAGTFILTASGNVDAVTDATSTYALMKTGDDDAQGNAIYGRCTDWSALTMEDAYTVADHGTGPYPYNEIQWIDSDDYDPATFDRGHLLYSGNLTNAPIIAPACIVTVKEAEAAQPTAPAKPSEIKDLPAVKISKAKKAKKAFTVKWKKISKKNKNKIAGIEVQYSLSKNFDNAVTKKAKKTKKSLKVKKLKAKTTYYVRVRAYKTINGVKHISSWSKVKKVKTK